MTHRFVLTAATLALAAFSTCAPAQALLQTESFEDGQVATQGMEADVPGRVGRISLVEGKVDISADLGAEGHPAQVNWPLTSRNMVSTAPGARTELRVGSTAIRLDGDSALEITELDDDRMRLRLHYGSASIRVMNAELLSGFELRTAQATVRITEPGRLRVDAERTPDVTLVSMLDGEARVDGAGASLTIRAGRSAELSDNGGRGEEVRTLQARRDVFDDWSLTRDQQLVAQAIQATRYVGTEMTGYEELDRHGSWSTHAEYGTLWTPTVVAGWTPYRDGSWTWIAPWGWTWVDNAPWGYAPFHYGRWVQVHNRWAWAPGRHERLPVWSPALVGWVGGAGWSASFGGHSRPAHGWYPLSPYDRYTPGYRLSDERLRRLNDWKHAQAHARNRDRDRDDRRRHGLTVVPNDAFGGRGRVDVPRAPRAILPPTATPRLNAAASPPPPPQLRAARSSWNDERRQRLESGLLDTRQSDAARLQTGQPGRERERLEQDRLSQRMQLEQQRRDRDEGERMMRERASTERLSRERDALQEQVARQQDERERMRRDQENRAQVDRTRYQLERGERERMTRERIERTQRQPMLNAGAPPPAFERRPMRSDPPAQLAAPAPRPSAPPPQMAAPAPRPSPPPQMIAAPPARPQSAPSFTPPPRGGEGRAHTDARGVSRVER